jgi:hypothetical protein
MARRVYVPVFAVSGHISETCDASAIGAYSSPATALRVLIRKMILHKPSFQASLFLTHKLWNYYRESYSCEGVDIDDEVAAEIDEDELDDGDEANERARNRILTAELKETLIMQYFMHEIRPRISFDLTTEEINRALVNVFWGRKGAWVGLFEQFMIDFDCYGDQFVFKVQCCELCEDMDETDGAVLL